MISRCGKLRNNNRNTDVKYSEDDGYGAMAVMMMVTIAMTTMMMTTMIMMTTMMMLMMTMTTMMIMMAKRIAGYAALEDKGNTLTTTLNTTNNEQLHK